MNEWISVKDQLPEEGVFVLCLLDKRIPHEDKVLKLNGKMIWPQRVLRYSKLNPKMDGMFLVEDYYSYQPTHWMPLPEPPK